MGKQIQDNKHSILRYLYHNRGSYKSRKQIENGTGLTEAQVRYAIDDITDFVEIKESETRGDIQDAYVYAINKKGRAYIENEIDEIPQEVQNSEEIEKMAKEIMYLRSKLDRLDDDFSEWSEYSGNWNDMAMDRFEAIEKRLEEVEYELMSD